ncbi:unnamed protein product, partial [Thlaspi arvense]
MNWVQRKIYLYNVTFGLYMLDWWERYLLSILSLSIDLIYFNLIRFFGDNLDVVYSVQRISLLFRALQ